MIREREKNLPPDESFNVAKRIKEQHCYTAGNLVKEYAKYDNNEKDTFLKYNGVHPITKKV